MLDHRMAWVGREPKDHHVYNTNHFDLVSHLTLIPINTWCNLWPLDPQKVWSLSDHRGRQTAQAICQESNSCTILQTQR